MGFYIAEIADNPRERADDGLANLSANLLDKPKDILPLSKGDIPVDICVATGFDYTLDADASHVMYRIVKPSRAQSDYGPREWSTTAWSMAPFKVDSTETCMLGNGDNGTVLTLSLIHI